MSRFAIIGTGIAGLTAGRRLAEAGFEVALYDKGTKPGGRLATRRGETFTFNHGCQYATARDPGFRALLTAHGAQPWPAIGAGRYVGTPDMASLAASLATGMAVHQQATVTALQPSPQGWTLRFADGATAQTDTLLLAIPAPQAAVLLAAAGHRFAETLAPVHLAPCWAVMLGFADDQPGPDSLRPADSPLGWIARENARPGRPAAPAAYTLHATAAWSTAHLEDPADAVIDALRTAFAQATGIAAPPVWARAHRWRYALADRPLGQPCLWDGAARLGLCGDWCLDGKLEAAYLSGRSLAELSLE
jgi:predicted NAD/FAD-dependent oxidoreductase